MSQPTPVKTGTNTILLFKDQNCLLYPYTDFNIENDILFWLLFTLLYIFIIIVCVTFVWVAVNSSQNLGITLISPANFFPGQFLQNQNYYLKLTFNGYLQLSSLKEGIYWESNSNMNYSTNGLVCTFSENGILSIQNYQNQILWQITAPPDKENFPRPFILNISNTGKVIVRSINGNEVYQFP